MQAAARLLGGLAVGSAMDGADAALIAADGSGLELAPRLLHTARHPFPAELRPLLLRGDSSSTAQRELNETVAAAAQKIVREASREVFCIGLLAPVHGPFSMLPEIIADASGITVLAHFGVRDLAAGGTGGPITPAADHLLFSRPDTSRLLVHLGGSTTLVLLPAGGTMSQLIAFDAGPGLRLADALLTHCSRQSPSPDASGSRAVQGRLCEELLSIWLRHPFLARPQPKTLSPDDFGPSWIAQTIQHARRLRLELNDLLCTTMHFIAQLVRWSVTQQLPERETPEAIHLSGRGTRNGLLRQLMTHYFSPRPVLLTDELGVPALARKAAAAAVLAALTLDGITGNLPFVTSARGGRLIGRMIPGEPPNWAAVAASITEHLWDYAQLRAAA